MNKIPTPAPVATLKKFAKFIILILFTGGMTYFAIASLAKPNNNFKTTDSKNDIVNINEDWWETSRLIYHGIPARCMFRLPPAGDNQPDKVIATIWREFDRIGAIFNPFDPDSEIFRLNAEPRADFTAISDDIFSVLSLSKQLWQATNGQFDPTMWQIKQLWQRAEKIQQIPSGEDIAAALQWTGFDRILFEKTPESRIIFKDHPVKFDFGGIVKGYAVDQVRRILLDQGVTAGLIQLGGEISTFGDNKGKPWRVGIQHPMQMGKIWGVISANSRLNVSTSGNYRQPVRINDKSFYHIFSPETGQPVSEKVLGVTTASFDGKRSNAWLDGLATAITVVGAEKGLLLAEKLKCDTLILYETQKDCIKEIMTKEFSNTYNPIK